MLANLLAHRVDLNQCTVNGLGPVILLGIQIEKKMAPRLPSRMRGMSMLPAALRCPRSNLPSESAVRVVVRVHDDRGEVQFARFFRDGIGGHGKNRKTHSGNPHNG